MAAGRRDLLEIGRRVGRALAARVLPQHLAVAEDGVERRAQLVAHVGQELALGEVGRLGRRPRVYGVGDGRRQPEVGTHQCRHLAVRAQHGGDQGRGAAEHGQPADAPDRIGPDDHHQRHRRQDDDDEGRGRRQVRGQRGRADGCDREHHRGEHHRLARAGVRQYRDRSARPGQRGHRGDAPQLECPVPEVGGREAPAAPRIPEQPAHEGGHPQHREPGGECTVGGQPAHQPREHQRGGERQPH